MRGDVNEEWRTENMESTDKSILEALLKRLNSPKSYSMDGESITMDTPEDIAKLMRMVRQADGDRRQSPSPFRISVCRNNPPCI